ncbi:hypothetical protein ACB092_07G195600 [Castanea dentata]
MSRADPVGTNNFIPGSQARANFPYNGIDFPHSRPIGRFSNGFNSADVLGYPPPFLSLVNNLSGLTNHSIKGINFASGGAGILDITGQSMHYIDCAYHIVLIQNDLMGTMGQAAMEKFLSKSLIFISIGSNDIFAYYHSNSSLSKQDFMSNLVLTYENHLKDLLNLGARKFGLISVPPIEELNDQARAFHATGMKYSLGNTFEMTLSVIGDPLSFNFKEVKIACCGVRKFNAESICDPKENLCLNHKDHCSGIYFTQHRLLLSLQL